MRFNAQPTANLLRGIIDNGSDFLHNLGGAFVIWLIRMN